MIFFAVRPIRSSRSRTTSESSNSHEVERRPPYFVATVPANDVRNGFHLDFTFQPFCFIVDEAFAEARLV